MAPSFACRWMSFSLIFHEKALREWLALDAALRQRLKAKLQERLDSPKVEADRLSGSRNRYKIKLMRPGVRVVYEVHDDRLVVCVIAVGTRERSKVYKAAANRPSPV